MACSSSSSSSSSSSNTSSISTSSSSSTSSSFLQQQQQKLVQISAGGQCSPHPCTMRSIAMSSSRSSTSSSSSNSSSSKKSSSSSSSSSRCKHQLQRPYQTSAGNQCSSHPCTRYSWAMGRCVRVCVCVCVCVRVCIVCRLPALDGRKEGNGSLHAHQCAALRVVFLQRFKLHAWICLPLFCSTWCTTGGGSPFLPCFAIKSLTSLFLPLRSKLSSASIPPALSLMSFNPQHEMCRTSQAPCLAAAATATAHRGMRCSWIMPPSQQVLVGARQPQVECHAS